MFTLEEQTRNWERRHPQYARKAAPENAARYEAMRQMAEMAEMAERASLVELEQLGFIEPPEDLGDLEDFAILDGVLSQLEECFEKGNVGGAEIHEYNDATRAMDALLARL